MNILHHRGHTSALVCVGTPHSIGGSTVPPTITRFSVIALPDSRTTSNLLDQILIRGRSQPAAPHPCKPEQMRNARLTSSPRPVIFVICLAFFHAVTAGGPLLASDPRQQDHHPCSPARVPARSCARIVQTPAMVCATVCGEKVRVPRAGALRTNFLLRPRVCC
ncbi:hypothetical protein C7974DRAFT_377758 [Boeremia exigua]|uniref:uncharacterized protein n=1 Tax=Boeremia exigua TaxID=749465 RepID=UPI001E8CD683|nr:uncharacterized protein C7974DRAFT_377758 [Boeremia exigua]KAH6622155.1 hypothetical protein C7974DRAFT_377758 [Boeremia exigua]